VGLLLHLHAGLTRLTLGGLQPRQALCKEGISFFGMSWKQKNMFFPCCPIEAPPWQHPASRLLLPGQTPSQAGGTRNKVLSSQGTHLGSKLPENLEDAKCPGCSREGCGRLLQKSTDPSCPNTYQGPLWAQTPLSCYLAVLLPAPT